MEKNADGLELRPRIGIGVLIQNEDGEILLSIRKSSHGSGEWAFPGGHLEFGETIFETAKREVKEETNLDVEEFRIISVNDELRYIQTDQKHYVGIGVWAKYKGGEPKVLEPHKFVEWKWFNLNELPEPLFEGTALTLQNYREGTLHRPAQRES